MMNDNGTQIRLPQAKGKTWFDLNEVVHIQGTGNYCRFRLTGGRELLVSFTIAKYERLLPATFWRVSKSSIVNSTYVDGVNRAGPEPAYIYLSTGERVAVSRRKYTHIKTLYALWLVNIMPVPASP